MTREEEREGMFVTGYVAHAIAESGPWMSAEDIETVRAEGHRVYRENVAGSTPEPVALTEDDRVALVVAGAMEEARKRYGIGSRIAREPEMEPHPFPVEKVPTSPARPPDNMDPAFPSDYGRPSFFARLWARLGTVMWS